LVKFLYLSGSRFGRRRKKREARPFGSHKLIRRTKVGLVTKNRQAVLMGSALMLWDWTSKPRLYLLTGDLSWLGSSVREVALYHVSRIEVRANGRCPIATNDKNLESHTKSPGRSGPSARSL